VTNDTMWTGVLVVLDWWTRISFHQVAYMTQYSVQYALMLKEIQYSTSSATSLGATSKRILEVATES